MTPRSIKRYKTGKYKLIGIAACLCLVAVVCTQCKTGKKIKKDTPVVTVAPPPPPPPVPVAPSSGEPNPMIEQLLPVVKQEWTYNTFSGKAKMSYGKMDFTANFRVQKGRAIWIAASAFGGMVQVARVYITPDSVRIVNYLEKEALLMSIDQAARLVPVPVDFKSLQNLVVGEAVGRDGTVTNVTAFGDTWTVQVEDNNYISQLTYNKIDTALRMQQLNPQNGAGSQGAIHYNNYSVIQNIRYPNRRTLNFQNGGQQYDVEMNFTSVEFDSPVDMPFSIPKGYTIK